MVPTVASKNNDQKNTVQTTPNTNCIVFGVICSRTKHTTNKQTIIDLSRYHQSPTADRRSKNCCSVQRKWEEGPGRCGGAQCLCTGGHVSGKESFLPWRTVPSADGLDIGVCMRIFMVSNDNSTNLAYFVITVQIS